MAISVQPTDAPACKRGESAISFFLKSHSIPL